MAARTDKVKHDDKTKRLIRASQLLNRLNKFAKSEIILSTAQVQAARIVIGKEIPDLKAIEHSGPDGKPINIQFSEVVRKIV